MKHSIIACILFFCLSANARQSANNSIETVKIPILCYHQVRNWKSTDSKSSRTYIIPVETFIRHIVALRDNGYTPVSASQLVDYVNDKGVLPSKPILITFDDGSESQYVNAFPILVRYKIKAVFFIMTVTIDHQRFMTRKQIKDLADYGFEVGCHTWDHQPTTKYTTEADYQRQLLKPQKELEQITGRQVSYFAYPYGSWNVEVIKHLQAYEYKAAFQLSGFCDKQAPLFTMRRILVRFANEKCDRNKEAI